MRKAISVSVLAAILVGISTYAEALPVRRTGSAASLQNIQSRSVQPELPKTIKSTSELPDSPTKKASASRGSKSSPGLADKLDVRVGSQSSRNLSGVFPRENTLENGGVRVLYKLNQQ